jgi:hypothetical protein
MKVLLIILGLIASSVSLVTAKVIELNENNWEQLLEGEWMVEL